ncbi:MAG: PTS glucitol/sorbitol transporter subunit IIA [Anaerolineales bacterium]|nr:PTS glucitol/sorbitol transporter subunit IIA [Anaerolineales bacterium]
MSITKYETKVTKLGPVTQDFMAEGILVFFQNTVPDELAEIAILHTHNQLQQEVVAGDKLIIDDQPLTILCVGEVANENLANLGHFVVKFNGLTQPEMPGDISVPSNAPIPPIAPGTIVKIVSEN